MRYWMIAGTTALLVTACGKSTEVETLVDKVEIGAEDVTPVDEEAVVTTSSAAAYDLPEEMTAGDDNYKAKATFPAGLGKTAPALAKALAQEADAEFGDTAMFAAEAQAEGSEYFRPFEIEIEWTETVQAGDLLSLEGFTYADTGGAHPNTYLKAVIHDVATGEGVNASDLFARPQIAEDLLRSLVEEAIIAEKIERLSGYVDDTSYIKDEVSEQMPEDLFASEIALAASTEPGKIGGLIFLFSPYDIGAYAEGAYVAVIPQSDFATELKPDYAALFGGEPVVPDET